jgi:hypothetical protein
MIASWMLLLGYVLPVAAQVQVVHEVQMDNVLVVAQKGAVCFCLATDVIEDQCDTYWTPESYIKKQFGAGAIVRGVLPSLNDGIVIFFQE